MKKTIRNILLCLFLSALPLQAAFASYGIYFKNNSLDTIRSINVCSGSWLQDICKPHNYEAIPLYTSALLTTINYDHGIKNSQNYIFVSHFITPNGDKGNFVRFTVHGDVIGSHFSSIDAYVNGQWSNLLNSKNDSDKVLPYKLGSKTYLDNTGKKYTISVVGTKNQNSVQGIDNIEMELTRFPVSALDKQNGASLDKHNGASLDKHNGASLSK